MNERRDHKILRDAHKNDIAVRRVSVPVMTISLEEGKYLREMPDFVVPLPWFKSCGVYVQGTKADETRDNLGCNVYECLQG